MDNNIKKTVIQTPNNEVETNLQPQLNNIKMISS